MHLARGVRPHRTRDRGRRLRDRRARRDAAGERHRRRRRQVDRTRASSVSAAAFERLLPDLVLLLGDRFEIFAAAQAALVANIPIAHIAGGDTTEGAFDEAIRHSITKMAHLHFVTNELSARRVRQIGEDPASIHVVGSPGLDHVAPADRCSTAPRSSASSALQLRRAQSADHVSSGHAARPGDRAAQLAAAAGRARLVAGRRRLVLHPAECRHRRACDSLSAWTRWAAARPVRACLSRSGSCAI